MTYTRPLISEPFTFKGDITGPAEVELNPIVVIELPDGTTEGVVGEIETPKRIDLLTNPVLEVQYAVSDEGAGNDNVRLQLVCRYVADTELVSKTADETLLQTVAIIDTLEEMGTFSFTLDGSLMAASDRIILHLSRLGTDGADGYTGSIGIIKAGTFIYRRSNL